MALHPEGSSEVGTKLFREEAMEAFMNVLWLRPENALWSAWDLGAVDPYLRQMKTPSLDMGCGDGVTSFINNGGRFGIDFDVYESVVTEGETYARPNVDYYDHIDADLQGTPVSIEERPSMTYTVGLDWKQALLDKASRLDFYERLIQHDAADPLPLEDGSFKSIFSNIVYWIPNAEDLLRELRRVIAPGGLLVMTCPDAIIRQIMLAQYKDRYGLPWIEDLDRGRLASYKHIYTTEEWADLFKRTGWKVQDHHMYPPRIVMQINDIGLRPMFPTFVKVYEMARRQGAEAFRELKRQWMENALHFLRPFCDESWMEKQSMPKTWHAFALEPA